MKEGSEGLLVKIRAEGVQSKDLGPSLSTAVGPLRFLADKPGLQDRHCEAPVCLPLELRW